MGYEMIELLYIKELLEKVLSGKVEHLVEARKANEVLGDLIINIEKAYPDCSPSRR